MEIIILVLCQALLANHLTATDHVSTLMYKTCIKHAGVKVRCSDSARVITHLFGEISIGHGVKFTCPIKGMQHC